MSRPRMQNTFFFFKKMGVKLKRLGATYKKLTELSDSFQSRIKVGACAGFFDALDNAVDVGRVLADTAVVCG